VGIDVEIASLLARDLGVAGVEFVPAGDVNALFSLLVEGKVDIIMSVPYLVDMLQTIVYSAPYFDGVVGFVVRDKDGDDFATIEAIRKRGRLTIGVQSDRRDVEEAARVSARGRTALRHAISPEGILQRAASGGRRTHVGPSRLGLSLLYPEYSVVVPQPNPLKLPTGIALRKGDRDLVDFVNAWLVIRKSSGALDQAYAYWVLGKGAEQRHRRWSIMHDVLGWSS
jgi:ABC-type amino acid transport substrate-binding protein